MDIGRSFEFDDGEAAGVIDRQQIENAALAAGEGGDLPVDGIALKGCIDHVEMGAGLRFEPGFGELAVEGMLAAFGIGRAGAVELFNQAHDLGDVALARRVALAGGMVEAEMEIAAFEHGELDAAHAQAHAAVVARDGFDGGQRGDAPPRVLAIWIGAAAGFEAGIEVATILRVDAGDVIARGVSEESEARQRRVEMAEPQRGGALLPGGRVDGEPLDGGSALARAQM